MKRVAITGAGGFLGSNLVRHFAAHGFDVRGLVRSSERSGGIESYLSALEVGDINDGEVLDRLMADRDLVIHTVSNFRVVKGLPESYFETNHQGTVSALAAASRAGVSRFVHCSTIGVHGDVETTPATEDSPFNPGDLYQQTKLMAENACREAMQSGDMEIVIIRPTSQYGPGDMRMLKMFRMLARGRFLMIGPCRENFHAVYIDDLVEGFRLAATAPGIAGEAFFLGGESYLPLEEYIGVAAAAVGAARPWIRLPYRPMYGAAFLCEKACAALGVEPPLHRRRIRFFKNNRAFDIGKAKDRLGYRPAISLDEGMGRTVRWYRDEQLL